MIARMTRGCLSIPVLLPLKGCLWYSTQHTRGETRPRRPCHPPRPSSNRPGGKHLRVSGALPSGAIAQAREEAEARYNRGESSRRGQHSSVQGRRAGAETGDQWQTRAWHQGWYASYQQESWYADSARSSADHWHEWPSAAAPTSRWRPRVEVNSQQMETRANETQDGWTGIDPTAAACQMDTHMAEPTAEAITPEQQYDPPDMQTSTPTRSKETPRDSKSP